MLTRLLRLSLIRSAAWKANSNIQQSSKRTLCSSRSTSNKDPDDGKFSPPNSHMNLDSSKKADHNDRTAIKENASPPTNAKENLCDTTKKSDLKVEGKSKAENKRESINRSVVVTKKEKKDKSNDERLALASDIATGAELRKMRSDLKRLVSRSITEDFVSLQKGLTKLHYIVSPQTENCTTATDIKSSDSNQKLPPETSKSEAQKIPAVQQQINQNENSNNQNNLQQQNSGPGKEPKAIQKSNKPTNDKLPNISKHSSPPLNLNQILAEREAKNDQTTRGGGRGRNGPARQNYPMFPFPSKGKKSKVIPPNRWSNVKSETFASKKQNLQCKDSEIPPEVKTVKPIEKKATDPTTAPAEQKQNSNVSSKPTAVPPYLDQAKIESAKPIESKKSSINFRSTVIKHVEPEPVPESILATGRKPEARVVPENSQIPANQNASKGNKNSSGFNWQSKTHLPPKVWVADNFKSIKSKAPNVAAQNGKNTKANIFAAVESNQKLKDVKQSTQTEKVATKIAKQEQAIESDIKGSDKNQIKVLQADHQQCIGHGNLEKVQKSESKIGTTEKASQAKVAELTVKSNNEHEKSAMYLPETLKKSKDGLWLMHEPDVCNDWVKLIRRTSKLASKLESAAAKTAKNEAIKSLSSVQTKKLQKEVINEKSSKSKGILGEAIDCGGDLVDKKYTKNNAPKKRKTDVKKPKSKSKNAYKSVGPYFYTQTEQDKWIDRYYLNRYGGVKALTKKQQKEIIKAYSENSLNTKDKKKVNYFFVKSNSKGNEKKSLSLPPHSQANIITEGKSNMASNKIDFDRLRIGFVGAGNIATAICSGLIRSGNIKPNHVSATAPSDTNMAKFKEFGCFTSNDNGALFQASSSSNNPGCGSGGGASVITTTNTITNNNSSTPIYLMFLCVKPNIPLKLSGFWDFLSKPPFTTSIGSSPLVIISTLAGVSLNTLRMSIDSHFKGDIPYKIHLARIMPNTATSVNQGTVGVAFHDSSSLIPYADEIVAVLRSLGYCQIVAEEQLDAVAGISGSGIAYVYTMIQAMADGGVLMGLPRETALHLAAQTVSGAANMVLQTSMDPVALRNQVCSPGGTTITGLYELEKGAFSATVMRAVEAATQKSRQFSKMPPAK